MRKQIVAGNWKMNTTPEEGLALVERIKELSGSVPSDVEIIVSPPFTHLYAVSSSIKNSRVQTSSQNCAAWEKGAYTGEVSVDMISAVGASYVIIGHSERREYFNETSETLLKKIELSLSRKLTPIFCCGEVLEERDANKHFDTVKTQINEVLFKLEPKQAQKVIIAYEPIWAIGTGRTATPDQAQEMHSFIRSIVATKFGTDVANNVSILYGGSCKPDNATEIFAKPDVDGGLIGGASLSASDFIAIAKSFPQ
ncbi:MAG: triose-phosphate isomerase [Bacteroidales bacterium]|nr:triose-phosphate isomerase [Tenuifilaceae bacterium]